MNGDEVGFERFVDLVATGLEWPSTLALLMIEASQDGANPLLRNGVDQEALADLRQTHRIIRVTDRAVEWLQEEPERLETLGRALNCSESPAGALFRLAR